MSINDVPYLVDGRNTRHAGAPAMPGGRNVPPPYEDPQLPDHGGVPGFEGDGDVPSPEVLDIPESDAEASKKKRTRRSRKPKAKRRLGLKLFQTLHRGRWV